MSTNMGRWLRRAFWMGDVIKDYGVIYRGSRAWQQVSVSVTLRRRGTQLYLVIRDQWSGIGYSSRWVEIDAEGIDRLDRVLHDVLQIVERVGPEPEQGSRDIRRR